MLKYLACYQVFWVKARCLQDQCKSILDLVFCYCVSNTMERKNLQYRGDDIS